MPKFGVILAAAGKSSRFGTPSQKKVFTTVHAKPLWLYAAEKFCDRPDVAKVVLVIAEDDKEMFNEKFAASSALLGIEPVLGGAERADSVRNGLEAIGENCDFVAVHDAARPCITTRDIDAVFNQAVKTGAAILGMPCSSTIKRASANGTIVETVPRDQLWLAQTPQVFRRDIICSAYAAHPNPSTATDEASIVEDHGGQVSLVAGSPLNIKVTTQSDLKFVEAALKTTTKSAPGFPFG